MKISKLNLAILPLACFAWSYNLHAAANPGLIGPGPSNGSIVLLESCPGDQVDRGDRADESAALALLTPFISAGINYGLKALGTKLSEDAKEQNIESLHSGNHFYNWDGGDSFQQKWRCMAVLTKGVMDSDSSLDKVLEKYKSKSTEDAWEISASAQTEVKTLLVKHGFTEQRKPGVMAIFDLEQSFQRSEFRLIPRFVYVDHSVREKDIDRKTRTFTYEFSFSTAGGNKFGESLVKVEGLVAGEPFVQEHNASLQNLLTSNWMAVPALSESFATRRTQWKAAVDKQQESVFSAQLAGGKAFGLGNNEIETILEEDIPCISEDQDRADWLRHNISLAGEMVKTPPDNQVIQMHTNSITFHDSCVRYYAALSSAESLQFNRSDVARSFDLDIVVKEFRRRPFAEFVGNILSDDTTRSALTTGLTNIVDPASRQALAETEAQAQSELKSTFDQAQVAAELAKVVYDGAATNSAAQRTAFIDMESKRRAANRAAEALGYALPYPASGLWVGAGS